MPRKPSDPIGLRASINQPLVAPPSGGLLRGAEAIRVYLNRRMIGGKRLSRESVYYLIHEGRIPVTRFGTAKNAEIWARQADLDRLFEPPDPGGC